LRQSFGAALGSALAQDAASFEVIVVDDSVAAKGWLSGSGCSDLMSHPRVRLVPSHLSRGCAAAKNVGLRAARGDWVCYLDDDNRYLCGKVSAQLALAQASCSPVVLCGLEVRVGIRRRRRQVAKARFTGDELLLDVLADTNVIFHRREGAPAWDEELGTADDACYFQALVEMHRLDSVPNVREPLVIYDAHRGFRANRDGKRVARGLRRLLVRWSARYGLRSRRILLLRALVNGTRFRTGAWWRWAFLASRLACLGGWRELRFIANVALAKLPLFRRWVVT
jgi:glycosyltransferase involved in cell wall biosynthesis